MKVMPYPAEIAKENTEVLDLLGPLLVNLVDGQDLTVGLLDLLHLAQEMPETGLCHDGVNGKDAHSVNLGMSIPFTREAAANNLILAQLRRTSL